MHPRSQVSNAVDPFEGTSPIRLRTDIPDYYMLPHWSRRRSAQGTPDLEPVLLEMRAEGFAHEAACPRDQHCRPRPVRRIGIEHLRARGSTLDPAGPHRHVGLKRNWGSREAIFFTMKSGLTAMPLMRHAR